MTGSCIGGLIDYVCACKATLFERANSWEHNFGDGVSARRRRDNIQQRIVQDTATFVPAMIGRACLATGAGTLHDKGETGEDMIEGTF